MKIIKLEVNDFRQFYGKQVIEFSVDLDKSVTLIHGENNGGKTALLNAIRWCLYEETTNNLLDSKSLLNKQAQNQGVNTFSVKVQLMHDGRLLEVIRSQTRASSTSNLKVFEIIDGCYSDRSEEHPNTLINTILPKEMSQYFFYQGEGTGTLNSQNDFSHINAAISKVLGLTVAEKTVTHLNSIKSGYQKELKQYDTSNEVDNLIQSKDALQSSLKHNKVLLEKNKSLLVEAEKEYDKQVSQFARFDKTAIDEKIKSREQLERYLSDYKRQRNRLLVEKSKSIPSWIMQAYGRKLGSIDLTMINTDELNNSLRYTVDKQLIKSILDNQECICGSVVVENSPAANLVKELEKFAVDPDLKLRWTRVLELHDKLKSHSSPRQEMVSILSQIDDCDDKINELKNRIKDLSHTIVESDIDDIKAIELKKDEAKSKCDQLRFLVPNLEHKVRVAEIDIKDIDNKIKRFSSAQPKARKLKDLIKATDEILNVYEGSIETSKRGVDLILLKEMQIFFSQVSFNGYTIKKDTYAKGDSFTWSIVDKEGKRVAAGNGYQAMLSISFIVALIKFSKMRANSKQHLLTPGVIAPFIADSILAFIGPDNGRELVRYIANSVEQSIFMFSQAQWTETHTDKGIRDKIGKEYNLVQHTVLTEEEFNGQYPTRLTVSGREFDVVRFGSEFEKVTIEEISFDD
ncbi:AAA family ATPase [Oceanimonas marisflavi]|uniref:AAA family ATPase n=1 Tax=Oceanimonas marisflavi TaxID=2059724 RepID=UPI000D31E124|nr:AAA family ATPase [Oceanimonas marisflavi]